MAEESVIYNSFYESPTGWIEIRADEIGLVSVLFLDEKPSAEVLPNHITKQAEQELREYFEGNRKEFTVALHAKGTDFQHQVWKQLMELPYGKTATYLDISNQLGDSKLTRAVGSANGKNPICVIVPCHRVIGSDGSLTGYAGGMQRKKWLLQHEGVLAQTELF